MPKRVVNTHEDADHVWGNQLFTGAEIISHRSVPERMKHVADPKESQKLLHGVGHFLTRLARIFQCAVKSHGSPVGETKQTHPGTIRSARNHLEG
ncbi:MAG: MBL fold metallo-hydrolase [Terrimicrobiaceae bacterium]